MDDFAPKRSFLGEQPFEAKDEDLAKFLEEVPLGTGAGSPVHHGEVRQGRRANQPNADAEEEVLDAADTNLANSVTVDAPPRPSRRQGGWADDTPKEKKKGRRGGDVETFQEDERLKPDHTLGQDDDDNDIPVIPDLEEVQEEDMATQIAAPPSVQVNRVATYKELDNYFQKHAALFTLDGEIDLKLLSNVLSPETEVFEEDKPWDWVRLFTEVASELQTEWDKSSGVKEEADEEPS